MKKRLALRIVLTLFLSLFLVVTGYSQQRTLTGKVTDEATGDPLPGVTIIIKGTTSGTVTNFEGNYSLNAEPGQTLVFSFIGYSNKEVLIGEEEELNVQLSETVTELEELVVIGYGLQKKEDKTGAVAQITADELTGGAITDPLQAIQGKSAGVMITKKGGDPNSGFVVKIRGAAGYDSDTQPLYVVDGVPGVDPTTVAPEDIETFNILKDASSTAIYGSQGSNGVILITTKQGSSDKSMLQFNVRMSVDQPSNRLDLLSANDLRNFASENGLNLIDGGADTDWQDVIFRNGISTSYNLNYSGGNEKTTFYASATQADWTGVVEGTSKERTIGKINITHKALNDRLTLSSSLSGTFEQNDYEDYNGYGLKDILYQAYSRNPTDPVYNEDGSFYQVERAFNYVNPLATIEEVTNTREAQRFYGNLKADLKIFEGFTGTVNVGYTKDDHENTLFEPRESWANNTAGKGRRSYDNTTRKIIETYFSYVKSFGLNNVDAVVGHSWQQYDYDGFAIEAHDAQSDFLGANNISSFTLLYRDGTSSYKNMSRLIGFFGRVQYNYNSKYYASASLRRDGSTKFGEDNKWGWFPTAAIGWSLHRESFLENVDVISNLKLRASYGVSGNESLGVNLARTTFAPGGLVTNPDNGETVVTFAAQNNVNPELKWEETREVNIGVDFGLFRNRVSGSLELYQKTTTDLLGQFPVPVPPNVARFTWGNAGSMENRGIELSTQIFAIDNTNFTWRTNLAVSRNIQTNTDLGGRATTSGAGFAYRPEGYIEGRGLTGAWVIGLIEGESLGSFYVPKYVGMVDGVMVYESVDGGFTDAISNARRYVAGTALPDVEIGWSNSMKFFDNWTLDITLRSMIGNKLYNATAMMFDYPGEFPTLNRLPEAIDWYNEGRVSPPQVSDLYVEDASFLRLDYISLAYDLNTSNLSWMQGLKVFVAGNNLFVLTNYSGIDPETSINGLSFGIDQYNTYPKTRSVSIGVNATF
ncbi:MAG: SusC/RagA family TonB-linked outer membrane protein [Bacteroidales bacterium]